MRATVLVTDSANQTTLIFINYSVVGYDSWESTQRALGVPTSGPADHSPFSLELKDKNGNTFKLSGFPFTILVTGGDAGGGSAKTTGWLNNGAIRWKVLKVARSGKWMDDRLSESKLPPEPLLTK